MSSQLSYEVLQSPDVNRWPQGSMLSLKEAAETVGAKVWEMSMRSRQQTEIDQRGFKLAVVWG